MIYLIGGSPRCGKTTLARRLSKKLGITWLSGDTFEGMVWRYVSKEEYPKKFPKNILRDLTHNINDEMYTRYTTQEIMDAYIIQGQAVDHVMEVLVEDMVKEKQNFIIEGYHVFPAFAAKMMKKYGKENFRVIYLLKSDLESTHDSLMAGSAPDDWVHYKTKDKAIIRSISEFVFAFSNYYKKEAEKYDLPVVRYTGKLEDFFVQAESKLLGGKT